MEEHNNNYSGYGPTKDWKNYFITKKKTSRKYK